MQITNPPSQVPTFTQIEDGTTQQPTANTTWQDFDLSGVIGTQALLCLVCFHNNGANSAGEVGVRTNGSALTPLFAGVQYDDQDFLVWSDSSGIIEIYQQVNFGSGTFSLKGYWS